MLFRTTGGGWFHDLFLSNTQLISLVAHTAAFVMHLFLASEENYTGIARERYSLKLEGVRKIQDEEPKEFAGA